MGGVGLELSIGNRWRYFLLFFYQLSICVYFFTIDFQPWISPLVVPLMPLRFSIIQYCVLFHFCMYCYNKFKTIQPACYQYVE